MARIPFQVRSGTPPEPEISESRLRTIEGNVRRFKNWQNFSMEPEVRAAIREAARWYCLLRFMSAEAVDNCDNGNDGDGGDDSGVHEKRRVLTVTDIKRAMKQLISQARKLEQTITKLSDCSNPHSDVMLGYLTKHGTNPEEMLVPLVALQASCARTIADVQKHERKGPPLDDALHNLIWSLTDIFNQNYGAPTTNWSDNSGGRNTPFIAFSWGIYKSLPQAEQPLSLGAFQERAHRVVQKWSEAQVKKVSPEDAS